MRLLSVFVLFFSLNCAAMLRIGIVDTGLDVENQLFKIPLCKYGHMDFTNKNRVRSIGLDVHGHGTHVAGLIHQQASGLNLNKYPESFIKRSQILESLQKYDKKDYCFVIYKVITGVSKNEVEGAYENFWKYVKYAEIDILNVSLSGTERVEEEKKSIEWLVSRGVVVVVAAGNDGVRLDEYDKKAFPASYKNVISVANYVGKDIGPVTFKGCPKEGDFVKKYFNSNCGDVVETWMAGTDQLSNSLRKNIVPLTGTSQATANYTGYLVKKRIDSTRRVRENNKSD
jgi:subtilisin family serine protease